MTIANWGLPALNANQVYALLRSNGATVKEAVDLTSIAVPESGFNPNSFNPLNKDYSIGLFQFNFKSGNYNASNPQASTRTVGGTTYTPSQLQTSLNAQAQSAIGLYRDVAKSGANPICATQAWYHCGISLAPGLQAAQIVGDNVSGNIPVSDTGHGTTSGDGTTTGDGTSGGGGTTSAGGGGTSTTGTGGTGTDGIKLASLGGVDIGVPSGLVIGFIGVLLLLVGAIIFSNRAQDAAKGAAQGAASAAGGKLQDMTAPAANAVEWVM